MKSLRKEEGMTKDEKIVEILRKLVDFHLSEFGSISLDKLLRYLALELSMAGFPKLSEFVRDELLNFISRNEE